jgi:uncharacterized protein with HEPN domain
MTSETGDFLQLIIDCVDMVQVNMNGLEKTTFGNDMTKQDAIIRRVIIIGECIKSLPGELKYSYPSVDWHRIVGVRDILVHDYWGIDSNLLYDFLIEQLPVIRLQMLVIIGERYSRR